MTVSLSWCQGLVPILSLCPCTGARFWFLHGDGDRGGGRDAAAQAWGHSDEHLPRLRPDLPQLRRSVYVHPHVNTVGLFAKLLPFFLAEKFMKTS